MPIRDYGEIRVMFTDGEVERLVDVKDARRRLGVGAGAAAKIRRQRQRDRARLRRDLYRALTLQGLLAVGATQREIAELFGVAPKTVYSWRTRYDIGNGTEDKCT